MNFEPVKIIFPEIIRNSLILSIIWWVFLGALFIQLVYNLFIYLRIFGIKQVENKEQKSISVIITARNEEYNLERFLPHVLEQNYPDFEVIVVNDASEDNSAIVLDKLQKKYKNLYVTNIPYDSHFSHGKKLAINVGVKAAKKEWIVFTDADCVPNSGIWLNELSKGFDKDAEIVLGYGAYIRKKGFLNKIIRYDTASIALQYLSYAQLGFPYMGVGRNMAVKKSAMARLKNYRQQVDILSGSDDLLVNELATKKNTRLVISPESFTYSVPETRTRLWWRQKKRHQTSFKYYKFAHRFLLALEPSSKLLFYIGLVALLLFQLPVFYVLIPFAVRFFVQLVVWIKTSLTLKEKDLLIIWFLFDTFVYLLLGLNSFFSIIKPKKIVWR